MPSNELLLLLAAPIALALVVAAIHWRPPLQYWSTLGGLVVAAAAFFALRQEPGGSFVNSPLPVGFVFFVVPTVAAFGVGRVELLRRRPILVALVALIAYLLALWLFLGLAVTFGLLEP
jgi:hypothetical protein